MIRKSFVFKYLINFILILQSQFKCDTIGVETVEGVLVDLIAGC